MTQTLSLSTASYTNEEFDFLVTILQRKTCLLQIASSLAKIPCVPNEFNDVLNGTKQNILDIIGQLDCHLPQSIKNQNDRVYFKIESNLKNLRELYNQLNQKFHDEEIAISFHLHVIPDPYIVISLNKKRELDVKGEMRSVNIIKISKDEYDSLRLASNERTYLKVVSREKKVSDLQFLHNDLDLLYRGKIEMSIKKIDQDPFMVLSFDPNNGIAVTQTIKVHKDKVYYIDVDQSTYNNLMAIIQEEKNDDYRCYLKIFAKDVALEDQRTKMISFLDNFFNVIPNQEPIKRLTKIVSNFKDVPLILLSTDKMYLASIMNSISHYGLFSCKLSELDYLVNKSQIAS